MGAADPTSGTVSLHEVVRGLGALHKRGWKPLRTIVIASWDAEEVSAINHNQQHSLSIAAAVWSYRKH
jgi:N-acetylated-alpha-linked acidic dipeptidase